MRKMRLGIIAAGVAVLLLSGCTDTGSTTPPTTNNGLADGPNVLRVFAGSEVKDMLPILADAQKATGVEVKLAYTGTLDGTQAVADGTTKGQYDASWFPSDRYLNLLPGGTKAITKETKIMSSPVVLGLKPAVAAKLGWDKKTPTWAQIVTAVKDKQLTYGMTSPVASNSGFSTLIEAATALSGTGNALVSSDITKVSAQLKTLFTGQDQTAGSSGYLADKFEADPGQVDGLFNYESVLDAITVNGQHLTIIRPSDGVLTADYPLALLSTAAPSKAALYNKLVAYLQKPAVQQKITSLTHRSTSSTTVSSGPTAFEIPFPNQLSTVQTLLNTYLGQIKKPSDEVFAIDTSGSMGDNGRLDALKNALKFTTRTDQASSFTSYQNRETVTYVNFADIIKQKESFSINSATRTADLNKITNYINSLSANGGTAIYSAMEVAYTKAIDLKEQNPSNFVSVVLFTDGENNAGASLSDFQHFYNTVKSENPVTAQIPAFVVHFGESNKADLTEIANLTGGTVFDAANADLTDVFKEIRGYQ